MKGENGKNEVGCVCRILHKSAFGFAMKVTHFINNTAAVGGRPVRFDGWLCISGSSAVVGRIGFRAKQPYQIYLESIRNMRTLPTNGKNKAMFCEFWDFGSTWTLTPACLLTAASHLTDLSACAMQGEFWSVVLPFREQCQSQVVPKQQRLDGRMDTW